eukprot:1159915-Pelagomonas_calceolata.AAC.1
MCEYKGECASLRLPPILAPQASTQLPGAPAAAAAAAAPPGAKQARLGHSLSAQGPGPHQQPHAHYVHNSSSRNSHTAGSRPVRR